MADQPDAPPAVQRVQRRNQLRLVDALYVELATSQGLPLVTTDCRLQAAPGADVVIT